MTYEEAGYIIGNIPVPTDNKSYSIEDYQEAKTLAVAALWDKLESVNHVEEKVNTMTTDEAIEIIQTIKKVGYFMDYFTDCGSEALDKAIEALKKETMCNEILNDVNGEWVEDINELNKYCSICHKVCGTIYEHENYCPNCGAKMERIK